MTDTFEKIYGKNTSFKVLATYKKVDKRPYNSFISDIHPSEHPEKGKNGSISDSHPVNKGSSNEGAYSIEIQGGSKKRKFTDQHNS